MHDPRKIITMTKMALYDKEAAEEDANIDNFFRHDYIYRQNMWLRLYVFLGCLAIIALYILHLIIVKQVDLFTLNLEDIRSMLIKGAAFILITQAIYTIIGTIQYTIKYERSQKRMKAYFALVDELEALRAQNTASYKRKELHNAAGTASMDTRKHNQTI